MNSEIAEKRRRLLELIEREGLDAVVLRRPANVAWYSGGGRTHILATPEIGVADVVVRPGGDEVVTAVNEAARIRSEELGRLEARFTVLPWSEPRERALPDGGRVGSDAPLPGMRDVGEAIVEARRELTSPEVDRYRVLGRDAATAMTEAALALDPSGTEFDAAAQLARSLQERGLDPIVLLVAGESRLPAHRHPLPTAAPVGSMMMLVACARRDGLIANLTRLVSFAPIAADVRDAHERLLRIDAAFIRSTAPGHTVGRAFAAGAAAYAANGFDAEEWLLHHQGGPTGYEPRDYLATAASTATIVEAQAFAWNPSAAGLKSEDTFVAAMSGPELLTVDDAWPAIEVDGIARPLVLDRS